MDLKVTSTGKIFRRVDSAIAGLLCDALPSVFEPVAQLPGRPHISNAESASIENHSLPVWSVIKLPSGKYAIQCDFMRGQYFYDGPAKSSFTFKVGSYTVPGEIAERYLTLKNQPSDEQLLEAAQERQQHAIADLTFQGGATTAKPE